MMTEYEKIWLWYAGIVLFFSISGLLWNQISKSNPLAAAVALNGVFACTMICNLSYVTEGAYYVFLRGLLAGVAYLFGLGIASAWSGK